MKLFAIGDLHLAHQVDKPMQRFGNQWENHIQKIQDAWTKYVSEEDYVIICGDISWALKIEEAIEDLTFINKLPGHKICIRGNHDYWWGKINYINTLFSNITFLQNDAIIVENWAICGCRGWNIPEDDEDKKNIKIYEREKIRLLLSLDAAINKGAERIVVTQHYPPTTATKKQSDITNIIKNYPVEYFVYGHLHDEKAWEQCLQGDFEQCKYSLVSADYLQFIPKYIMNLK
ncbi:MAG: metallophosphoesterase [Cellulosilyticaceae bacterium]